MGTFILSTDDQIFDLSLTHIDIVEDDYIGEYFLFDRNMSLITMDTRFGQVKKELLEHMKEGKYSHFICRKYNHL